MSRSCLAFDAADQATATDLAHKASVILSDAGAGVNDDQMALRFHDALLGRRMITLAIGVVMEREGVGEDAAFNSLLRLALYHGETLRGRAEIMVRSSSEHQGQSGSGSGV